MDDEKQMTVGDFLDWLYAGEEQGMMPRREVAEKLLKEVLGSLTK